MKMAVAWFPGSHKHSELMTDEVMSFARAIAPR